MRYNGVYIGKPGLESRYCEYLRFYPDKTVIVVTTECDPSALQDIKAWFDIENGWPKNQGGQFSLGKVKSQSDNISFFATSPEGKVHYRGKAYSRRIFLRHHSLINGARGYDVYSFVRW